MKELIGHENTKKQLLIAAESASKLNTALPHTLFTGIAGCGKTSMARYVAYHSNVSLLQVPATDFKDYRSVVDILERLSIEGYDRRGNRTDKIKPTILFVDEIHRMPITGEEPLGVAMEDLKIPIDKEGQVCWVPHFTLVGATTDDGSLSKPFRERFELRFVFNTYSDEEIIKIIEMNLVDMNIAASQSAIRSIARRGRGIPRITKNYLRRARDRAVSMGGNIITSKMVEETFEELGIDIEGFNQVEIKILKALYDASVPIGLDNLSVIANESPKALQASAEPHLIRKGYMVRSGKGRLITKNGRRYLEKQGYTDKKRLKIDIPADYQRA
jgi:Holliday junction DNA helicase RuvB